MLICSSLLYWMFGIRYAILELLFSVAGTVFVALELEANDYRTHLSLLCALLPFSGPLLVMIFQKISWKIRNVRQGKKIRDVDL